MCGWRRCGNAAAAKCPISEPRYVSPRTSHKLRSFPPKREFSLFAAPYWVSAFAGTNGGEGRRCRDAWSSSTVTTRIDRRFAELKQEGRAALVTFTMAGDPDYDASLAIIKALPAAGADVIEIGMPFTDPMADGPAIQAAGVRALKAGQNMTRTLALVRDFRKADDTTPIVLMGYYNPIYIYGVDRFLVDAHGGRRRRADRGGPAARGGRANSACRRSRPASTSSAWRRRRPTTSACRRCSPTPRASSTTSRSPASPARRRPTTRAVAEAVARIKRHTGLPVAVGFGVRTAEQAARDRARRRRRRGRLRAGRTGARQSRSRTAGRRHAPRRPSPNWSANWPVACGPRAGRPPNRLPAAKRLTARHRRPYMC